MLERLATDHDRIAFVQMVDQNLLVPLTKDNNDMDLEDRRLEIWRHAKAIGLAHSFPPRTAKLSRNQGLLKMFQPQKYREWCRAFRDPVRTGLWGLDACTATEAHSIRRGLRILRIALAGVVVEKYGWEDATQQSSITTTTEPSP